MFRLDQLGPALRFLRSRSQLKQLQVAARAGITSSMLSGYENGRKMPTLATLEKILTAMDCRLADLLQAVERPPDAGEGVHPATALEPSRRILPFPSRGRGPAAWGFDLEAILGSSPPLDREETAAFGEMLSGYCRWLRYLRQQGVPSPQVVEDP